MAEKFKTLVVDRFDVSAFALLKAAPDLEVKSTAEPVPTDEDLAGVRGLIARSRTKITESFLARAPQLEVLITGTSGFDHIDLEVTAKRGIKVMFTPGANAASAAELTWGLILSCLRKIPDAGRAIKAGDWRRDALVGRELRGKTLGIVGLGRIGGRVARVGAAFGMKVIAFDPYIEPEDFAKCEATRVSFEELLRLADVISFHVPATPETHHMLTRMHLESMHNPALLVNSSRGSVVAERDLIEALNMGWIAGAGLDVFEIEPLPRQSGLMKFPNVVLTPHLGATTQEAFAAASREAAEKLLAYVRSGTISDPLPPEAPWAQGVFGRAHSRATP